MSKVSELYNMCPNCGALKDNSVLQFYENSLRVYYCGSSYKPINAHSDKEYMLVFLNPEKHMDIHEDCAFNRRDKREQRETSD